MGARGIMTFLGRGGRNRGELETGVEEELSREVEETGMEGRVLELNRDLEEETEMVVARIGPKGQVRTGVKMEDKTEAKTQDKLKPKTEAKAEARTSPSSQEDNPQASVLEMSCRPVLMFVQDSLPEFLVLVCRGVLRGARLRSSILTF